MKHLYLTRKLAIICCLLGLSALSSFISAQTSTAILQGKWILDMTPENPADSNFASMEIRKAENGTMEGDFYRQGVEMREGRTHIQAGIVYGALVSGDNSGDYNTAFYYEDGALYGTTHSLKKDFLSVWTAVKEKQPRFTPSFTKSENTTHEIPEGHQYVFGYLEVLENRSNPLGKTIRVPVYIFKSRSLNPKPDPIIYTVGGPGSTTMPSAQYMKYYKYLDDRDFILIEQRGNYYAEPHLDCPEWVDAIYEANLPNERGVEPDNLLLKAASDCRDRLQSQGIDLDYYNTNEIAADIADLRNVLGIENYNLLTISYSTKIGQVLLRDFPEGIRSVVMDSPLPLEVSYDEESVGNLLVSTGDLLAACEADEECNTAYPNLKERFFDFLTATTNSPLAVDVVNPETENVETFYLSGKDFISIFSSSSTGSVSNVPFEINKVLNNDFSSIKKRLSSLFLKPNNGGDGVGMRLSVWCAEEHPFNDYQVIEKETRRYPEVVGLSPAVFDSVTCAVWGVSSVPEIENYAVKSNVPVLLISGEYDNETPSKWANGMRSNLKNSYHLIYKGWKHALTTNWVNQCAMQAANDFYNNPGGFSKPACFEEITSPKFKTE